jgi:glycosyltransferase involved in cell wall biosynthesis
LTDIRAGLPRYHRFNTMPDTTIPQQHSAATHPIRACMLAYTFYESDGRVMRYAEALAQEGALVDAIVLGRPGQPREEFVHGVRVLRVQTREKNESGKFDYLRRILRFLWRSAVKLTQQHFRGRYDLIHVHSVPDFEVFAALVPKLTGARIVLDIHDIVPEFYAAKFGVSHESLVFRCLKLVERLSVAFADHVIAANDIWRERLVSRSTRDAKCSAFINYPDLTVFRAGLRSRGNDGRFIVSYPGTLNWHQGVDIAVRAFAIAKREVPCMEFQIHGEGSAKLQLQSLIGELGLEGQVVINPALPLRQIASVMANADLGVVPKRNDSFGGEAFSTKILEFMALGVPVVVAETRIDRHYFNDGLLRFFEPEDVQALAQALVDAYRQREQGAARAARALGYVRENSWGTKKHDYLAVVRDLIDGDA